MSEWVTHACKVTSLLSFDKICSQNRKLHMQQHINLTKSTHSWEWGDESERSGSESPYKKWEPSTSSQVVVKLLFVRKNCDGRHLSHERGSHVNRSCGSGPSVRKVSTVWNFKCTRYVYQSVVNIISELRARSLAACASNIETLEYHRLVNRIHYNCWRRWVKIKLIIFIIS